MRKRERARIYIVDGLHQNEYVPRLITAVETDPLKRRRMLASLQSHETEARKGCRKREECEQQIPLKYGYVSILGRKRVMEEQVTVMPPQSLPGGYSFFAAYAGGARSKVADSCADKLHHCLEDLPEEKGLDLEKVVKHCFSCMFEAAERDAMVKFTAVVVAGQREEVVVVNCGGSTAVLWTGGVVLPLWTDHKSEKVEGGRIMSKNEGVISSSRSQGDESMKGKKRWEAVSTTVLRRNKNSEEDFLIIASEGVWKVVGKEMACEVVRKCLGGKMRPEGDEDGASQASAILAELAIAKGSEDNITIIVVHLNSN